MKPLFNIVLILLNADRWAMARGAALMIVVLVMGAALLGLSGWFITATGLAGLAGIGIAFDVFRPSAGVRFLALGRAGARYGERLLTHDATLRALSALRVVLLRGFARGDARELMQLRGEGALTRVVSDVDALDGVLLRLVLPVIAVLVAHLVVFATLTWVVGWSVACVVFVGYLLPGAAILYRLAQRSIAPSQDAEKRSQMLRREVIDMIRDREALILASKLPAIEQELLRIEKRARAAVRQLDKAERAAGFQMQVLVAIVSAGALVAGATLIERSDVGAAVAVIGFFVALALAEAFLPLRRGMSDLGRMVLAGGRVGPQTTQSNDVAECRFDPGEPLLSIRGPDIQLEIGRGQAVVLTGPSGAGKSTLLFQIAGLVESDGIAVKGAPPQDWPEPALRRIVASVPQRSALIAGTVRDNLSLTDDYADGDLWAALDAASLAHVVSERGGLDAKLGEGGKGLSGGQARRLCIARSILKKSEILLLDEPTEGLDPETANAVLSGVRRALPETLIIAAMHRGADHPIFDTRLHLARPFGDDVTEELSATA